MQTTEIEKEQEQPQKEPTTAVQKINPPKLESTPLKGWVDETGKIKAICDPNLSGIEAMRLITGTKDLDLATAIIDAGSKAIKPKGDCGANNRKQFIEGCNLIMQSMHDFKPQDAVEARLITQATVAFEHAMSLTNRGTSSDMLCHLEPLTNLAIKFMRVHNETIEALNRYRRGGEQKVTVTHVAEKMAVVHNYGCTGVGGTQKNQGGNPCQQEHAEPKQEQTTTTHADSPQWQMDGADSTEVCAQVQKRKKGDKNRKT